jgi:exodeoxyribonuclease-3
VNPLRVVSWNIRAGGGRRVECIRSQLLEWDPDIICLSEFRGTAPSRDLATSLGHAGYSFQLTTADPDSQATNSLLLASRYPVDRIRRARMPDNPRRWLLARIHTQPALLIGTMHIPNHTNPELKFPFMDAVLSMAGTWRSGPGLFIGDTNCGKRGIDEEKNPTVFYKREHDWMEAMERCRWVDGFRHVHGECREFTWYSHRNNGFRLDHAFCSPKLVHAIERIQHVWGKDSQQADRRDAVSDHAAIILDLALSQIVKL